MRISIHSLKRTLFDGAAQSVNCKTAAGEITVLDHHRPLISILAPGVVTVTKEGGAKEYFSVKNGILEVKRQSRVRAVVEEER